MCFTSSIKLCSLKRERGGSHRAFGLIVLLFIVEIDKRDPQEDTEEYDGIEGCWRERHYDNYLSHPFDFIRFDPQKCTFFQAIKQQQMMLNLTDNFK